MKMMPLILFLSCVTTIADLCACVPRSVFQRKGTSEVLSSDSTLRRWRADEVRPLAANYLCRGVVAFSVEINF